MEIIPIFAAKIHSNSNMARREIIELFPKIQDYLKSQPVEKAWLFGSCSRGEDGPDSDIDILMVYDKDAHVSLLTIGGIYMDMKALLGREVDLVEEGTLLPFAMESAERDKILIYEKARE